MTTYNILTTSDIGKGLSINQITKLLDIKLSSNSDNIISFDNNNNLQLTLPAILVNLAGVTPINNTVIRYKNNTFEYVSYATIKQELYPFGNNNKVLYNNNGDFGLINNVESDGNDLVFLDSTNYTATSGKSKLISYNNGVRSQIAFVDSDGFIKTPAMSTGKGRISSITALANQAAYSYVNSASWTTMSINDTAAVSLTATKTGQIRRTRISSNIFDGSYGGVYDNVLRYFIGSTADLGGFYATARFGLVDSVTNTRTFVGFTTNTSSEPSSAFTTRTNFIGLVHDITTPTPTKLYFAINGTSTSAYLVDTGFTYASGDFYDFDIYCPPNATTIKMRLRRINDDVVFTNTIDLATIGTTKYPSRTTLLAPRIARGNVGNLAIVSIDFSYFYIESFNN